MADCFVDFMKRENCWNKEQIATYKAIVSELEASGADMRKVVEIDQVKEDTE